MKILVFTPNKPNPSSDESDWSSVEYDFSAVPNVGNYLTINFSETDYIVDKVRFCRVDDNEFMPFVYARPTN